MSSPSPPTRTPLAATTCFASLYYIKRRLARARALRLHIGPEKPGQHLPAVSRWMLQNAVFAPETGHSSVHIPPARPHTSRDTGPMAGLFTPPSSLSWEHPGPPIVSPPWRTVRGWISPVLTL
jgi:hypothetical protein